MPTRRSRVALFVAGLTAVALLLQLVYLSLLLGVGSDGRKGFEPGDEGRRPLSVPGKVSEQAALKDKLQLVSALASHEEPHGDGRHWIYRGIAGGSEVKDRAALDVTLTTHTSLDRLHELDSLLIRWGGPVSLALFCPGNASGLALWAISTLRACSSAVRDRVSFHLVYPARPSKLLPGDIGLFPGCDEAREGLTSLLRSHTGAAVSYDLGFAPYPNNLLRNVARTAGGRGRYVLPLDVDMIPSSGLRPALIDFLGRDSTRLSFGDRTVFVLPAFESRSRPGHEPGTKAELLRRVALGDARPFYSELCGKCQRPTDFDRWVRLPLRSTLGSSYDVPWRDPWEPFFLSPRSAPLFDERFQQYGFNRISQACELHVAGYRFAVLDEAFVVHKGFKMPGRFHASKDVEQEKNRELFRHFKAELKIRYPRSSRRC
uniref:beta-1,4-glucuronyltransferase 1 n=1 Tax=Myxine glutinosa TaxID=7769 RepID=UPI00358E8A2E